MVDAIYRSTILRLLGTYGTIFVLVAMMAAFSIAEPDTFATVGNFRNILNDMAIGTIVAGGLTVPLVAGDFDLSIGYVASFCGLLLVGLLSFNQLPIPVAMLIVIAIGDSDRRRQRNDRLEDWASTLSSRRSAPAPWSSASTMLIPAAFRCSSPTALTSPTWPSAASGAFRTSW